MIAFLLFYILPIIICRNCNRWLIRRGLDTPDPPFQWFTPMFNIFMCFEQLLWIAEEPYPMVMNHPQPTNWFNLNSIYMWFTNKDFPNINFGL